MAALLMTRPIQAARRFAASLPADLRAALPVIYAPLIEIRERPGALRLAGAGGVIFTSQAGVAAALHRTKERLPAHCVGSATAAAAAAAGWLPGLQGETADDLCAALAAAPPAGLLVHLRGAHARGDVAARLTAAGLGVRQEILYDQQLLPLTDEALAAVANGDGLIVPLFSPRTARHFAELCPDRGELHLIALSAAVAEPLKRLRRKGLQVCKSPDAQAMAAAVGETAARIARLESGPPAQ